MLGKSLLFLSSCQKSCMLRRGPVGATSLEGRCAVLGFHPRTPCVTPVLPGPGSDTRMKMEWKIIAKTEKSGVWFFQNAGGPVGEVGTSVTYGRCRLGLEGIVPHCVVGPLWFLVCLFVRVRARPRYRATYLRAVLATASWCVEGYRTPDEAMVCRGRIPTVANLNLYRGWNSRAGWHCDDEPLFGVCGVAKLIVSVSFGTRALFRWKGKSCLDIEASSCCLGYGDILVMDGQCQDEFFHCGDPGLEQERINVTVRWIRQHAAHCPHCGQEWYVVCQRVRRVHPLLLRSLGRMVVFGAFWVLLGALCKRSVLALLVYTLMCTGLGLRRCAYRCTRPLG